MDLHFCRGSIAYCPQMRQTDFKSDLSTCQVYLWMDLSIFKRSQNHFFPPLLQESLNPERQAERRMEGLQTGGGGIANAQHQI